MLSLHFVPLISHGIFQLKFFMCFLFSYPLHKLLHYFSGTYQPSKAHRPLKNARAKFVGEVVEPSKPDVRFSVFPVCKEESGYVVNHLYFNFQLMLSEVV